MEREGHVTDTFMLRITLRVDRQGALRPVPGMIVYLPVSDNHGHSGEGGGGT